LQWNANDVAVDEIIDGLLSMEVGGDDLEIGRRLRMIREFNDRFGVTPSI